MDALPEYAKVGLRKVAIEQGFVEGRYWIKFESGSNKGDGLTGTLVKVFIRQDGREQLVVLAKIMPDSLVRQQQSIGMFRREVMAYNVVIPALLKFQLEKGISVGENPAGAGFWRVPKCYYAYCDPEKLEAVVIMEDLRDRMFRMWNKFVPVDYEHTRLLLEQLGKLHAVSFAMRDQQPEQFRAFQQLVDPIQVMMELDPKRKINSIFAEMYERAIASLSEEKDAEVREQFGKLRGFMTERFLDCVNSGEAEPYAVVGHGDCWINNVMYAYDGDNPIPNDIRLIDWQLCHYVSPILDLSYFIFICTDEKLRDQHYDQLLDVYYASLCEHLERLGGDAKRQFPREIYDEQWTKYGRFGMIMGLIVVPMICTAADDLPDMDDYIERLEREDKDARYAYATEGAALALYQTRIRGLIRDVARFGYLNG